MLVGFNLPAIILTDKHTLETDGSLLFLIFYLHCSQTPLINISSKTGTTWQTDKFQQDDLRHLLPVTSCLPPVGKNWINLIWQWKCQMWGAGKLTNNSKCGSTTAMKRQKLRGKAQMDEGCWHTSKKQSKSSSFNNMLGVMLHQTCLVNFCICIADQQWVLLWEGTTKQHNRPRVREMDYVSLSACVSDKHTEDCLSNLYAELCVCLLSFSRRVWKHLLCSHAHK